jgi:hypothetical protein
MQIEGRRLCERLNYKTLNYDLVRKTLVEEKIIPINLITLLINWMRILSHSK